MAIRKIETLHDRKWLNAQQSTNFYIEVLDAISMALDLEYEEKLNHGRRVAYLSAVLAEKICPRQKSQVFYAGLFHDIGAVSLPNHCIRYVSGELSSDDEIIQEKALNHSYISAKMLRNVIGLTDYNLTADFVLEHHENWDGSGFPVGKKNDAILIGSQLLSIADYLDGLIWRGKKKVVLKDILADAKNLSGSQFSHDLIEVLHVVLTEEILKNLLDDNLLENKIKEIYISLPPFKPMFYSDSIESLFKIITIIVDSKHPFTSGHTRRVAEYSKQIAKELQLSTEEINDVEWTALLHDIGKIPIPSGVLSKHGSLTSRERTLMQKHACYTKNIVSTMSNLKHLAHAASSHHERYDGNGYPHGLSGEEIPLGARIISVADSLDAMTSNRLYGKVLTFEEAKKELIKESGLQFDPVIVKAALRIL